MWQTVGHSFAGVLGTAVYAADQAVQCSTVSCGINELSTNEKSETRTLDSTVAGAEGWAEGGAEGDTEECFQQISHTHTNALHACD